MEDLKSHTMTPISAVPGLYISDIHAARNLPLLKSHGISHVLSLTRKAVAPRYTPQEGIVEHRVVEIEDDPLEDLVGRLGELCGWIEGALSTKLALGRTDVHMRTENVNGCEGESERETKTREGEGEGTQPTTAADIDRKPAILIHCLQGISRSGALITACVMRHLSLDYDAALAMARKDRDLITPNPGFVEQLRLWHILNYEISKEGGEEKQGYVAWKTTREDLASGSEERRNRERAKGMANLAARFGARRLKGRSENEGDGGRI